jgi:hypothetical protein
MYEGELFHLTYLPHVALAENDRKIKSPNKSKKNVPATTLRPKRSRKMMTGRVNT